jgi:uncharacterized RDD family membrane protein YckC
MLSATAALAPRREALVTDTSRPPATYRFVYDPATQPELFDGILSKRIVAFIFDAIAIVLLMIPAALMVLLLGVLTFGIAWLLFPLLFAIVALGYVGFTLGGSRSATPGMRLAGVTMRTWNGQKMFPVLAIMHALVFWFSVGILTPFILLVGLFTYRRQLLHDLVLGVVALNADALARREI